MCLLKDPLAPTKNTRRILEKVVEHDSQGHTEGVFMLAELLMREKQFNQAIQVLSHALETRKPSANLHLLLADCYVNLQKPDEAIKNYTTAMRLDPDNQLATEGQSMVAVPLRL